MKKYRALQPIGLGGKRYLPGETIELNEKQVIALAPYIVEIPESMQPFKEIFPDDDPFGEDIFEDEVIGIPEAKAITDSKVTEYEHTASEESAKYPINKLKKGGKK